MALPVTTSSFSNLGRTTGHFLTNRLDTPRPVSVRYVPRAHFATIPSSALARHLEETRPLPTTESVPNAAVHLGPNGRRRRLRS